MSHMINGLFPGYIKADYTVAGCIDIYEHIWPNPENTINNIEKEVQKPDSSVSWMRAETIGNGTDQELRTNYNLGITYQALNQNNAAMQNIHNQFNMLLLAATASYTRKYNIFESLSHEHYNALKYSGGQEYKAHYDGGTDTGRGISALVYLNEDFDGGEIEFVNFGVKIKPQKGMLILFPSNYAYSHIAHPVTLGTKYALVTWIHDR